MSVHLEYVSHSTPFYLKQNLANIVSELLGTRSTASPELSPQSLLQGSDPSLLC